MDETFDCDNVDDALRVLNSENIRLSRELAATMAVVHILVHYMAVKWGFDEMELASAIETAASGVSDERVENELRLWAENLCPTYSPFGGAHPQWLRGIYDGDKD